jgi:hypothetical protein
MPIAMGAASDCKTTGTRELIEADAEERTGRMHAPLIGVPAATVILTLLQNLRQTNIELSNVYRYLVACVYICRQHILW